LRDQLGLPALAPVIGTDQWPSQWGELPGGTQTRPGAALFPRLDKDQEKAALAKLGIELPPAAADAGAAKGGGKAAAKQAAKAAAEAAAPKPEAVAAGDAADKSITYEDFAKVELRVALVLAAERVPKSDKLLKLSLDAGDPEPRQILAGIAQHYDPEVLVGKRVVIVANLKPRKLMGLESQGMVLAASDETGLFVTTVTGDVKPGSIVK
jgi:methionyl-tRNA synthetase